ncbi:MAG: Crp/Fnr family transcriptional regulator [Proteobacteria bacterium]|nr:Crp/Fnr family transcriptional regulator [Pseudomonadota bacterium]
MNPDIKENIVTHFPQFEQCWDKVEKYLNYKKFHAKKILLRDGEVAKTLYFILNGCIRTYLIREDGREITMQFFFEGQMVASMESFFSKSPGRVYLETIEETGVVAVDSKDFEKFIGSMDPSKDGLVSFLKHRLFYYMSLHTSFIADPPEKRYLKLIEEHPRIMERVPQHYIATYLGITPVSLSRIRGRIRNNKINKG